MSSNEKMASQVQNNTEPQIGLVKKGKRCRQNADIGNVPMTTTRQRTGKITLKDINPSNIIVLGEEGGRVTRGRRVAYEKPIVMEEDCTASEETNISRKISRKSKNAKMNVGSNSNVIKDHYFENLQTVLLMKFCTECVSQQHIFQTNDDGTVIVKINDIWVMFTIPSPQLINIQAVDFGNGFIILPNNSNNSNSNSKTNLKIKSRSKVFSNLRKSTALFLLLADNTSKQSEVIQQLVNFAGINTMNKNHLEYNNYLGDIIFGEADLCLDKNTMKGCNSNVITPIFQPGQSTSDPSALIEAQKNTTSSSIGNDVLDLYTSDKSTQSILEKILEKNEVDYHYVILYDVKQDSHQKLLEIDVETLAKAVKKPKNEEHKQILSDLLDRHFEIRQELNSLCADLSKCAI